MAASRNKDLKGPTEDEIQTLEAALGDGKWHSARDLRGLGNERRIRLLANASRGFIGSGQRGYKLTVEMDEVEFEESAGGLESQVRRMHDRVREMREVWRAMGKRR